MSDEAKLESLLQQLKDDNPKKRKKACEELGRLGNPKAIIDLSKVYRDEYEVPEVKEAAAESLRFFALMEAGGGKIGGGGSGVLRGLSALLTLSLIALVALNVMTRMSSSANDGTPQPTQISLANATQSPRDILLVRLTNEVVLPALDDINGLRAEWGAGAGNLACAAQMSRQTSVPFSPADRAAYPDIAAIVDSLNNALSEINLVVREWDSACASPEKGTAEQAGIATEKLNSAEAVLFQAADAIVTAEAMPTPAPTQAPPTPLPTVGANILSEIERRANSGKANMTSLINDRWLIVQGGQPSAFKCAPLNIPQDYTEVSEAQIAADEDLGIAVVELNLALSLARKSADAYVNNCNTNTLSADIITQGLADANEALSHFENVLIALGTLRQR